MKLLSVIDQHRDMELVFVSARKVPSVHARYTATLPASGAMDI